MEVDAAAAEYVTPMQLLTCPHVSADYTCINVSRDFSNLAC